MKEYSYRFGLILISQLIFLGCNIAGNNHVVGNSPKPKGVLYSYNLYGVGSSQFKGALLFIVHSNNGLNAGEYYELTLRGNVIHMFHADSTQLVIPDLWPGYYNFTVTIGCNGGKATNADCYLRSVSGTAHAKAQMVSVMDVYL